MAVSRDSTRGWGGGSGGPGACGPANGGGVGAAAGGAEGGGGGAGAALGAMRGRRCSGASVTGGSATAAPAPAPAACPRCTGTGRNREETAALPAECCSRMRSAGGRTGDRWIGGAPGWLALLTTPSRRALSDGDSCSTCVVGSRARSARAVPSRASRLRSSPCRAAASNADHAMAAFDLGPRPSGRTFVQISRSFPFPACGGGQGGGVVTRPSRHRVGRRTRPPHHPRLNWKGVASREGQGGTVKRTFQRAASRLATVLGLGFLLAAAAFIGAMPAAAASGIGVYVGYADSSHPNVTHFPTPWAGSPNVIFEGCPLTSACVFDAGAVQVINNSGSAVTVNSAAVTVGSCTFSGWPSVVLPNGGSLIVTQTAPVPTEGCSGPAQLDSSDIGTLPNCAQDNLVPVVEVSINGTTTSYTDSGKVLNTGGTDGGVCSGNESTQWTKVGTGPCAGSQLSLDPSTQTHGVGTTATVTATFTNTCGQPLPNVSVQFAIPSGPNAGRTGSGTTNAG